MKYRICIKMPYGEKQWHTLPGEVDTLYEAIDISEYKLEEPETKVIDENGEEVPYPTDNEAFTKMMDSLEKGSVEK